jgi:integrase/recombinase XerD
MKAPLTDLLTSWLVALAAEHKSTKTIRQYGNGVRLFLRWCDSTGRPAELTRANVQAWLASLFDGGAAPTTVRARFVALQQFSKWMAKEEEIPNDALVGMTAPKLDVKLTDPLTDAEVRDMIRVCKGNTFRDRRDEALIRFMAETGIRAGECMALRVSDVDLREGVAVVIRGKGGKSRPVPFSAETAAALDKYIRTRRAHKLADKPELWLGVGKRTFSYSALYRALVYRAELAGIPDFHPHRFRHTATNRWLRNGGSEGGAMAVMGWKNRTMLDRYVGATASTRAIEEARGLRLGQF